MAASKISKQVQQIMVEEGAQGVLLCDKNGLPIAACGCFSAGDAGFVRSLWTSPLEGGDAALTVNGVEHQITVTPTAEERLLALAMRHATAED